MYECSIIKAKDFGFNHHINHIDDHEDGYYPTDESEEETE